MSHKQVISIALSGGPDRRSFVVDGKVKSQKNMQSWLKEQLLGTPYVVLPRATRQVSLILVPDDVKQASDSKRSLADPEAKSIQLTDFLSNIRKMDKVKKSKGKVKSKSKHGESINNSVKKKKSKSPSSLIQPKLVPSKEDQKPASILFEATFTNDAWGHTWCDLVVYEDGEYLIQENSSRATPTGITLDEATLFRPSCKPLPGWKKTWLPRIQNVQDAFLNKHTGTFISKRERFDGGTLAIQLAIPGHKRLVKIGERGDLQGDYDLAEVQDLTNRITTLFHRLRKCLHQKDCADC